MIKKSLLNKLVFEFRKAIEKAKEKGKFFDEPFRRFPNGCCGDACDLLAQYLLENGINSKYVCGTYYEDQQSHAWLEIGDIIADITADQFKGDKNYPQEYITPCYVGKKNRFYELFEEAPNSRCRFYGIKEYGNPAAARLLGLYETICAYI